MSQCPAPKELKQLLDGTLDDSRAAALGAHLETCSVCQRELDEMTLSGPPRPSQDPSEVQFAPPESAGEVGRLGRYRVLKKLGAGGMGAVYLGFDAVIDRKVALKVMLPQFAADDTATERFLREARAAAMVKSDHVVTIFDVGEEGGVPFIAMEYLLGAPLDRYLKTKGELPQTQVVRVARETAQGLAAAHELGLIHRDIKSANLWLEAPKGRVKILDFGLARTATGADAHLTGPGAVLGTPAYMAPEQARGLKLDARSDLFSLGVVLYRLATGKMPFTGPTVGAVLTSLAVDTPTAPRKHNPEVSEALEAVITKLLAKHPADRFQTAEDVIAALADVERSKVRGPLPVVVPVSSLAVGAQTQNVWAGIEDSASIPVPVSTGGETLGPTAAPTPAPPKRERKANLPTTRQAPKWPLLVAVGVFLIAVGGLVAVLRSRVAPPAKEGDDPPPDRSVTDRPKLPAAPLPPEKTPDFRAAEYVHNVKGTGSVRLSGTDQDSPLGTELPKERFVLTTAYLTGPAVKDEGLVNFRGCKDLMRLHLTNTKATGIGFQHLKDCKGLTHLTLSSTNEVNGGLGSFSECRRLTHLQLDKTNLNNDGLEHFKGHTALRLVDVSGTKVTDAGLKHLAKNTDLNTLVLEGTEVGDGAFATLAGFKNLTLLDVRKTKMTAPKVRELGRVLLACRILYGDDGEIKPTVTSDDDRKAAEYTLEIGGTVYVNGASAPHQAIRAAANLPERFVLTGVDFYSNGKITAAGLSAFAGTTGLTSLRMQLSAVTDAGLKHFQNNTGLKTLDLMNTGVSNAGLAHFEGCKELTHLALIGAGNVTDAGIAYFAGCPLVALDLEGSKVTDAGLEHFKGNTTLVRYNFGGLEGVTDKGLANFKGCSKPQVIGFSGTGITDEGLDQFKGCTTVTNLSLSGPYITDNGLANFAGCADMDALALTDMKLTAAGTAHFRGAKKLRRLILYGTAVGDEGLAPFAGQTNLISLGLRKTNVTDAGLEHFKGCKKLGSLILDGNPRVGGAGLAHFRECELVELFLSDTAVTDTGLTHFNGITTVTNLQLARLKGVTLKGLDNFAGCKNLRTLHIQNTGVTTGAQGTLKNRHPKCGILHDKFTVTPGE